MRVWGRRKEGVGLQGGRTEKPEVADGIGTCPVALAVLPRGQCICQGLDSLGSNAIHCGASSSSNIMQQPHHATATVRREPPCCKNAPSLLMTSVGQGGGVQVKG